MGMYKPFLEFSRHSLAKDIYSWTGAIIVYCWRGKKIPNEKQQRDKFYDLFTQIILYKLSPMWKESCRACTVNVDSSSWLAEPYKLGRRGLLESCGPVSKSDLTAGSYVFCSVHLHALTLCSACVPWAVLGVPFTTGGRVLFSTCVSFVDTKALSSANLIRAKKAAS